MGIPSFVTYLVDILILFLGVYMLYSRKRSLKGLHAGYIKVSMVLLIGCIMVGVIFNMVAPQLVLWAFRNSFRGIIFWIACIVFLRSKDIDRVFDVLFWIQIANTIISVFQYFVLHYNQDFLGGIFGTQSGVNGSTNVLFVMLFSYYCAMYVNKKQPFWKLAVVGATTILITVLAELKIFFIEFALIVLLCLIFSKPSIKGVRLVTIAIIAMVVGLIMLKKLFPLHFSYIVSLERMIEYASLTSGGYSISRLDAFSQINDLFFKDNWFYLLFGQGFGSCEMSAFEFLTSPFFMKYGYVYNFRWFSHMMLFLETGYVGLFLFISLFVGMFIFATRAKVGASKTMFAISVFTQVFALLTIANIWYNQAIRTEAQYMTYFALAACFIYKREHVKRAKLKSAHKN